MTHCQKFSKDCNKTDVSIIIKKAENDIHQ